MSHERSISEAKHEHDYSAQMDGYKVCQCGAKRLYTTIEIWEAVSDMVVRDRYDWFSEDLARWHNAWAETMHAPAASREQAELLRVAINAEKYMTERGVSHEYPVLFELRAAIRALQSRPAYDRDALKRLEREIDEDNGNRIPESRPASAEPSEKEVRDAFSRFACEVMAIAISGYADAAVVKHQPMNETHALQQVEHLAKTCREMRAAFTAMRDQLQKSQWVEYSDPDYGKTVFCPNCRNDKMHGHHKECELAAALALANEVKL